ncbi:hypothetical protein AB5N19_14228 [Seiridium cardinale]|uniref:Uncharacterized protein n=1 Tax=Seiridium cardinale TaxID=138064 RepID=A0ABR2XGB5_9PEZI
MHSSILRAAAACLALAGAALAGTPYNLTVNYKVDNVDHFDRVWYGDGNLYIGTNIPASIQTAFNFTVPAVRADLLYIEPTTPGATLPDPTFLTLNNAEGAADPLFFLHSAASVTDDNLIFWFRYANIVFPILNDGTAQSYFFLDSTEAEGTYVVKWKQGGLPSSTSTTSAAAPGGTVSLTGLGVQLTAGNPS